MAQVPYSPVPKGQPVTQTPSIRLNLPGAAFGTNIGEALQKKGGAMTEFGNDIFAAGQQILKTTNEFEARQKLADFEEAAGTEISKFDALPDGEKMGALQAHTQRLKEIHEQFVGQVGSIDGKLMFLRESQPFLGRSIFSSSRSAGLANKQYQFEEDYSAFQKTQNTFSGTASDNEIDSKVENLKSRANAIEKWGLERKSYEVDRASSNAIKNGLLTRIDGGDVESSAASLEKYRPQLKEEDYRAVENHLNTKVVSTTSRTFVDDLYRRGLPIDEAYAAIEKKAETFKNEDVRNAFIDRSKTLYYGNVIATNHIKITQERQNSIELDDLIASGKVKSVDDLHNTPEGIAVLNKMDSKQRNTVDKKVIQTLVSRNIQSHDDSLRYLYGLAQTDPNSFLKEDPFDPKWHLSINDIKGINAERRRVMKDPTMDPDIKLADKVMRQDYGEALDALHLSHRPTVERPNDEYHRYFGVLREGVAAFTEAQGHKPSEKEIREQIAPHILKEVPGYFWGKSWKLEGDAAVPMDKTRLDEARTILDLEARKRGLPPPNSIDVRDYAVHQEWEKLLAIGGKSGSLNRPAGPTVPPANSGKPAGPQPSGPVPTSK